MVREVRQRVFAFKNGETAQLMKQSGMNYSSNYGVSLPQLKEIAAMFPRSMELSEALQAMGGRENELLSLMFFPLDATQEQLQQRALKLHEQEEAEIMAMFLAQRVPYAVDWALVNLANQENNALVLAAVITLYRQAGRINKEQRTALLSRIAEMKVETFAVARMTGMLLGTLAMLHEEEAAQFKAAAETKAQGELAETLLQHYRQETEW